MRCSFSPPIFVHLQTSFATVKCFTLYVPFTPLKVLKVVWNVSSQFFNVVKPKKGSIHELSDAIPLHLQWPQWVHPFECQAVHNLDLVTLHFTTRRARIRLFQPFALIHRSRAARIFLDWIYSNSAEYFTPSCYDRMKIHIFVCKLSGIPFF